MGFTNIVGSDLSYTIKFLFRGTAVCGSDVFIGCKHDT